MSHSRPRAPRRLLKRRNDVDAQNAIPQQSPPSAFSRATTAGDRVVPTIASVFSGAPTEKLQADRVPRAGGDIFQDVARWSIGSDFGPYSFDPALKHVKMDGTPAPPRVNLVRTKTVTVNTHWEKNMDLDDELHNPSTVADEGSSFDWTSGRGWANSIALGLLLGGLVALFLGYPLILFYTRPPRIPGLDSGLGNGTNKIPSMHNFPKLIDEDSPSSARTFSSPDGQQYQLVFSDEFNVDGRSFYPGDDPWWEAVDLHYWPTDDLEWYDPEAVTTKDGNLVLTMSELNNHNLSYQSGMLQSWNKVCVNGGYIEVSVSLPGSPSQVGFWPAAWTMGNLGRAGYGATTEGMWPYTYDSCDWGTLPNQTTATGLPAAVHDEMLSFLPGQRASACTCPGSDHPGPSTSVGRGVPEIDILEALTEVNGSSYRGQISQSTQIAPYNDHRWFDNSTTVTTIQNASITKLNHYLGGQYQQTVSALSYIEDEFYGAQAFATYGIEWFSDPTDREKGFMNWYSNGQKTWGITAASIGPDSIANVSARLISEEPMYIILNLGMSPTFQPQNFSQLVFPATMLVDYVRVYQSPGAKNGLSCDPPNRPTADYIAQHSEAYTNANLTTWAQAGHTFPRNSLLDGC